MHIILDLDNTIVDELGQTIRPGMRDFLERLKRDGDVLSLWTNSSRPRARTILREHGLGGIFNKMIFREDYDPGDKGIRKDIRMIDGDLLIDDDPGEIEYVKSLGKSGILVASYRKNSILESSEMDDIYKMIKRKKGIFGLFTR